MKKYPNNTELTANNLTAYVRDSAYMVPVPVSYDDLLYWCLMVFQHLGKVINVFGIATFTSIHENTSNTHDTLVTAPTSYNSLLWKKLKMSHISHTRGNMYKLQKSVVKYIRKYFFLQKE